MWVPTARTIIAEVSSFIVYIALMFEASQHANFPFSFPWRGCAPISFLGFILSLSNLSFIFGFNEIYFFRSFSVLELAVNIS